MHSQNFINLRTHTNYSYLKTSAGNILAAFQDGKILAKIDKEIEVNII